MNGPTPASQPVDTATVLASLESDARDPAIPASTRTLLLQAHRVVLAASGAEATGRRDHGAGSDRREDTHLHFRELMDVIDQAIVMHDIDGQIIHANTAACRACRAIAPMSRFAGRLPASRAALNLGLVAEGVESEQQRDFLMELGVGIGQGYLYAPGLDPEQLQQHYSQPEHQ